MKNFKIIMPVIGLILLYLISSCKNNDIEVDAGGEAVVKVNMVMDESDELGDVQANAGAADQTKSQVSKIELNKDFSLIAELQPEPKKKLETYASLNPKALLTTENIIRQIKFRVVVYNNSGDYVADRSYQISATGVVSPITSGDLQLTSGTYTFVAYSYNTNAALTENFTGTNINTPFSVPSNADFMYYSSGPKSISYTNPNNFLNVKLKQMLSKITVKVDATATNGYNINSIGPSTLASTRGTVTMDLNSGIISHGGITSTTPALTFSGTGTAIATANTVLLANNTSTGSLVIGALSIGPLVKSTISTFNNVVITPSVRYNLVVKVIPNTIVDENINEGGIPAVKINGKIWMRHNVGVNTSLDADVMDVNRIGNYIQFGSSQTVGTGSMGPINTSINWRTAYFGNTAWTNANPHCPTGWRIPTQADWDDLIDNTTQLQADNIGGATWPAVNNTTAAAYSKAKVFRSKRDYNVKLTFPAAGYYDGASRALTNRAAMGVYWASTPTNATTSIRVIITNLDGGASTGFGSNNHNFALPVRCIKQ